MTSSTVVFITGIARGIGNSVAAAYLLRPNHIVIGSVRDARSAKVATLSKLSTANGSRLLLVGIENTSTTDPKKAVAEVEAAGIDHIDIVVSCSGVSPDPAPLDAVDPKVVLDTFNVNTISSILLFQAVNKLLAKSSKPKWITVSSRAGSIGQAADFYYYVSPYGLSKAAQGWFTATLHVSNQALTVFAVHPGFVSTDMGIAAATNAGIDMPPTSAEESATKLLKTIDTATRETTGGKLLDIITGETYLW